jgi:hypothetical protein
LKHNDDGVIINLKEAERLACGYELSHKTIIVTNTVSEEDAWIEKPPKVQSTTFQGKHAKYRYWYEFPSNIYKPQLITVGPLSERTYIHVSKLFEQIELSGDEKESHLTVDDVLFACRGLCADDKRGIERFSVLSDDGHKLVLLAHIDNWST